MANEKQLALLMQGVDVWNKWREENPYIEIDLEKANLAEAKLSGVDFRSAKLIKANFKGSILTRANLWGANLYGADLTVSTLWGAIFKRANLSEASLVGAILTRADLAEANLRRAILSSAHLRMADLTNARLTEANLTVADLTEANLSGAWLSKTYLSKTNLMGAILTRADLGGAILKRTNLRKTDLEFARIGQTIFGEVDLSDSVGLETARHFGPSTVGTNTILLSKGKIPVEFLRGCGLSDPDIEYAKLAAPGLDPDQIAQITYEIHRLYCDQPILFHSCFISYNSKDQDFVQRLHDDLQNNGVRCWFAPEDMKIGDEFRKAIGSQIRLRDKLLIILSENSIKSEWVGDEVEKALAEEKEQGTLKLFPIRIDDAVFNARDDWAEKIRLRRHIGDFSSNYEKGFERLLRDLKAT